MLHSTQAELIHYGVLGMRWGKRKALAPKTVARRAEIDKARERLTSGKAEAKVKKAKTKLSEAQKAYDRDYTTAMKVRDGREATITALGVAGTVAIAALAAYKLVE